MFAETPLHKGVIELAGGFKQFLEQKITVGSLTSTSDAIELMRLTAFLMALISIGLRSYLRTKSRLDHEKWLANPCCWIA